MEKFAGNFRRLGDVDVSAIRDKVLAFTDEDWLGGDWRRQTFEAHKDTDTVELVYTKDIRAEAPAKRAKYAELDCDSLLAPVLETICDYFTGDGFVVRALLVRLKAGGVIDTHVDSGYTLMSARRVHVPVVSNGAVVFTVGQEPCVMGEGELWEINNARPHGVENTSPHDRVHLIVDWMPT